MLVAGGTLTAGTVTAAVVAYNGSQWQGVGRLPEVHCSALWTHGGQLIAAVDDGSSAAPTRIVSWDGAAWQTLGSLTGDVNAMAVFNGDLVVAGSFAAVNGVPAANIAQWNGTTWSPFASGVVGTVRALAVFSGVLYVGGSLSQASGVVVSNLAIWNGTAWAAGASFNGPIRALAVRIGDVLVAGDSRLPSAGVFPARFDGQTLTPLPTVPTTVVAGAWTPAGEALLAGEFATVGGVISGYLARLVTPCVAAADPYGGGCAGSGGIDVLAAAQLGWTGGTFRGLAIGLPASGAAAVVFGISPISVPLSSLLAQGLPGCTVVTTLDFVLAATPSQGRVATQLAIPAVAGLVGLVLHHQVITVETAGRSLLAATSTNGLRLTIGML